MPNASVIIPTHNRANFLRESVDSAWGAGTDLEVIVVDDASTDETRDVCDGLKGIKYIRLEHNSGTSHARNVGIEASSSEYVAFLDDDDLRLPGTIDLQLEALRASPSAAFVYGLAFIGDPHYSLPTGQIIPPKYHAGDIFWELLEGNFVTMSTVVARKRCLLEVGLFKTQLDTLEDYDLWVRLAERFPVEAVPEPLAVYRGRSESSGQKTSDRAHHDRYFKQMYAELLRSPRALAAPRRKRRRTQKRGMSVLYNSIVSDAAGALINGDRAAARAYLLAALRFRPFHIKAHGSLLWLFVSSVLQREL